MSLEKYFEFQFSLVSLLSIQNTSSMSVCCIMFCFPFCFYFKILNWFSSSLLLERFPFEYFSRFHLGRPGTGRRSCRVADARILKLLNALQWEEQRVRFDISVELHPNSYNNESNLNLLNRSQITFNSLWCHVGIACITVRVTG